MNYDDEGNPINDFSTWTSRNEIIAELYEANGFQGVNDIDDVESLIGEYYPDLDENTSYLMVKESWKFIQERKH